ncbi:MAG: hypothetical protein NXI25_18675 [bacterium]|nr:hypothetical protein [bacterium]
MKYNIPHLSAAISQAGLQPREAAAFPCHPPIAPNKASSILRLLTLSTMAAAIKLPCSAFD